MGVPRALRRPARTPRLLARGFAWDGIDPSEVGSSPPRSTRSRRRTRTSPAATVDAILRRPGSREGGGCGPRRPSGASTAARARRSRRPELDEAAARARTSRSWCRSRAGTGSRTRSACSRLRRARCAAHGRPPGLRRPGRRRGGRRPRGRRRAREAPRAAGSAAPRVRERVHLATLPMDDLEENAAIVNALQRRAGGRAEEPGRGLRPDGGRGDVEGAPGGGQRDRRHPGPDRGRRDGLLLDDPRDLAAFGAAVRALLDDPARGRGHGRGRPRARARPLPGHRHLIQYATSSTNDTSGRRRTAPKPKRVVPSGVVRSPTSPPAAGASLSSSAACHAWTSCARSWRSASVSSTPFVRGDSMTAMSDGRVPVPRDPEDDYTRRGRRRPPRVPPRAHGGQRRSSTWGTTRSTPPSWPGTSSTSSASPRCRSASPARCSSTASTRRASSTSRWRRPRERSSRATTAG